MEQYENLEKLVNKKLENESRTASNNRNEFESKINEKIKQLDESYQFLCYISLHSNFLSVLISFYDFQLIFHHLC